MGELTDPAFIRRLEGLSLIARTVLGGSLQADRRSTRKGAGITFADYSEYSLGDDWRAIDWRVYARSDELVTRLFEVEEDATIHVLLDCSPSMAGKFEAARRLAAAFGYIALDTLDRLAVWTLADRLGVLLPPCHGRGRVLPFLRALEEAGTAGTGSDLLACARTFQKRVRRRGLVLVISDFLVPGGAETALDLLRHHHHDCACLRVQDDNDRICSLTGDLELACVESGASRRLTVTESLARGYEAAVAAWNRRLEDACRRRGVGLHEADPTLPFDEVVTGILRRGGLVG